LIVKPEKEDSMSNADYEILKGQLRDSMKGVGGQYNTWLLQKYLEVEALELTRENAARTLGKADILVNATSVGMSPNIDETPVTADLLKPGLTVFDIVYNPVQTKLLCDASERDCKVVEGVDMLVYQGAAAFELWTGARAPVAVMRRAVMDDLRRRAIS